MIVTLAVKLVTLAASVGLWTRSWWDSLNEIWDIVDSLNAPPTARRIRSVMLEAARRRETRRMIKALRS